MPATTSNNIRSWTGGWEGRGQRRKFLRDLPDRIAGRTRRPTEVRKARADKSSSPAFTARTRSFHSLPAGSSPVRGRLQDGKSPGQQSRATLRKIEIGRASCRERVSIS